MLRRVAVLVAVIGLLTGCSSVKLTYNQLDWLVPVYVAGYVDLDEAQTARLKTHVAQLLEWHCASQLHEYALWLRTVGGDFQAHRVSYRRLERHHDQLQRYWRTIAARTAPRLTELLHSASDDQVDALFASLAAENAEFRQDYVDRPAHELRKKYAKKMRKRLKRWLGRLTPEQKTAITAWSRQVTRAQAERLQMRLRWQAVLQDALRERGDKARLEEQIRVLFVHPERLWSNAYREQQRTYHQSVLQLLEDISTMLTDTQREHLRERTTRWADDLEALACSDAEGGQDYAVRRPALRPDT